MEQTFREFVTEVCKKRGHKSPKVKDSMGVYDFYKRIRKHQWFDIGRPLKEHEFYSIIRGINKILAEEIADGNTVVLPSKMGKLELRKYAKGVKMVNGKLKITYPIDWGETLKLWFEDEEARNNKTLIRDESGVVYHVKYDRYDATYENKSFYQFQLNRFVKKALCVNIRNGKVDTLW